MEEVYRFPPLRLKPAVASSPFVIPKSGDPEDLERENKGETHEKRAIKRNVPDLDSRFRGNDGKRECVETQMQKIVRNTPPTLPPFIPSFCKRLKPPTNSFIEPEKKAAEKYNRTLLTFSYSCNTIDN
jgi:hypothetical protein